jgi:polar amino acid transport system substrate-binding protein
MLFLMPTLGLCGVKLTPEEKAFLKEHPVIRTQCSYGSPAFEQIENGRPTGYIIEYLRLLARTAGFEIDFGEGTHVWEETEQKFRDREIDFLTGTVGKDLYQGVGLLSEPYLYFHRVYVVRKDAPDVHSPYDLIGKTVSAMNDLSFVEVWKQKHPGIRFLMVGSDEEALRAVAEGRADATFTLKSTCDYFSARNGFSNLRIGGVEKKAEGLENCFRMAIRSDWPELLSIVNKAMDAIPQKERQALWDEWFGRDPFNYALFYKMLGGACALMALFLVRYRTVSRYNKKLKSLNDELERSLEERDRIMSVLSHDLRQPVHGYNRFLALLQRGDVDPASAEGQRILRQSRQRGEQAIECMENLLTRLSAGRSVRHPVTLSPHRVVEDCRELLEASLENKRLTLDNRIDPDIRIESDEQRLAAVLRNLLNNAIKFSHAGAFIEVESELIGDGLRLMVCDHGTGMDEETIQNILSSEPIESVRGTDGERGSGMGLSLCRQFLQAIGSDLEIESTPGQGTCVSFLLK